MPPLYIVEQGAKLRIEKRRLLVQKNGQTITKAPLAHTTAVIIFGNASITTPAMKRLMRAGIDVVFLTRDGQYEGRLVGPLTGFGLLRQHQYELLRDIDFRLQLSQTIVRGKCLNMRTLLMRYNRDLQNDEVAASVQRLDWLADRALRTKRLNALLGVEGSASAAYFSVFRQLFKRDWPFPRRARRPPPDPVNVLLSFGYTLLTRHVEAAVSLVGLDPYIGVLHVPSYGRPSLALDLVEEFRATIVDAVVLRCLNNDIITPADFTPGDESSRPVVLSDGGKRRFIREYETRVATKIQHPVTGETMAYLRVFEIQTRLLARCLRDGNIDYRPFRIR
ncbi:CRISPR-associated endonuclease Cas1 [Chloroflexota bacterium]